MRFTTNAYPREQREEAWRFALKRWSLEVGATSEDIYGELITYRTGQSLQFARITGTAETITLDFGQEENCFWMVIPLEGEMEAADGRHALQLAEGDIAYGAGSFRTSLTMPGDHRLLLVKVPSSHPALRSRSQLPESVNNLISGKGLGRMLSGLLRAVADTIGEITDDQLRPLELALPEFISTTLLDAAPAKEMGGAAGARAAILDRVFQTIEMRLSDPSLNIHMVASEHGISPRYLQKLFEEHGESFSQHVKLSRLERCRLDLGSPLHSQRSISEILFQWGFNDSASFSRAFRERYGVSPREYRKSPRSDVETQEVHRRGRPGSLKSGKAEPILDIEEEDLDDDIAETPAVPRIQSVRHHYLPVSPETVHWGFFSPSLKPVLTVDSGDFVTIETLTHHANDDRERMIEGDPGAESVYAWSKGKMAVERRGAGPMDASAVGRGPGEGFGVHICTGPIEVAGAKPGDVIEIRIIEIDPRPSGNPRFAGRCFGSNAAAFWGFHYTDLLTEPKQREVITIYEVETERGKTSAHAVYNFRWTPQTDPSGILHERMDYPGVPVDHDTIQKNFDILRDIEIPVRPHFGVIGLAPPHPGLVDSIPPSNYGGNIDNWRMGAGASLYLPVGVDGGLLSMGDPHASQGDSEVCGTAIECSMTAMIQVILHPAKSSSGLVRDLDYPVIETSEEWVVIGFSHPDYLRELGGDAQSSVYEKSSLDLAMRDAFRKARRFLMTYRNLSEDEAISLLSVAADFAVTQVANGNWGVHCSIRKSLFAS